MKYRYFLMMALLTLVACNRPDLETAEQLNAKIASAEEFTKHGFKRVTPKTENWKTLTEWAERRAVSGFHKKMYAEMTILLKNQKGIFLEKVTGKEIVHVYIPNDANEKRAIFATGQ